jgi:predicted transcriptional regulator
MAKTKISVTLGEDLAREIQELASIRTMPLSNLVEAALRQFLAAQLEAEMEAGYRVMAGSGRELAEADMTAGFEVLPDA